MKALFITSLLGKEYGGAEVSTGLLLESLKNQGIAIQALTTRKNFSDKTLISVSLPIEVPKKLITLGNKQVDYFISRKIRKQLQIIQPDIIHIQDTYILPATVMANRRLKIPSVATIRNSVLDETWHLMFPKPISTLLSWRNTTIIKSLNEINYIISVSEYIKTELIQRGINGAKIFPIYNLPPTFKENALTKLNTADSAIHLFAPGFLASFKGFSVLVKAMAVVTKTNCNVDLTIAGDGPQKNQLEQMTKKLGLERHIFFIGKIPFHNLSELYNRSNIVIFPSIYAEPFGRVALEAMYFGKPVIASNVGGIPEVVENNVTGLVVTPNNPSELAQAILTLVRDSKLRERLGQNGKLSVNQKFSAQKILCEHLKIYDLMLSKTDNIVNKTSNNLLVTNN